MRCLIINMATATDRMGFMEAQMAALGLEWERVEAVTPDTLAPGADHPVWRRWQRPLRVTEMALCASHMAAWRRVLEVGAPCVILEDDAVLAAEVPVLLQQVAPLTGIDHVSLELRGRKKLMARKMHPDAPIRRLYLDRTGSAAMVVWPSGAQKLLTQASRVGSPSDALISGCTGLVSFQADPAVSVQLDQCDHYGVAAPLRVPSLIDQVSKPSRKAFSLTHRGLFRMRRISAQLRMFGKAVVLLPVSTRREPDLAQNWLTLDDPTVS